MLGQFGASTDQQLILYVRIGAFFCVGNGVNTVFWGKKDCISWVETKQKASREGITRNPRGLPEEQASPILWLRRALIRDYPDRYHGVRICQHPRDMHCRPKRTSLVPARG
jgi:hypothetical protein